MAPETINFKNTPVQASIISRIINLDVDSNRCFQQLDELISSDQGVASLVLRVVNSPFYSRGNKVATIPLAISLLGYNVVRSLALLAFSRSLFAQTSNPLFRLHIWQHSLLVALASQAVCRHLGAERLADEAFIAGLMHDTGKVLLYTHQPSLYEQVINRVLAGASSSEAERELFGMAHCEVGVQAVKEWKLPERFNDYMGRVLALPCNPVPGEPVMQSLVSANYVLNAAGIGGKAIDAIDDKLASLRAAGLPQAASEFLLQEDFISGLMESETYQLCASI